MPIYWSSLVFSIASLIVSLAFSNFSNFGAFGNFTGFVKPTRIHNLSKCPILNFFPKKVWRPFFTKMYSLDNQKFISRDESYSMTHTFLWNKFWTRLVGKSVNSTGNVAISFLPFLRHFPYTTDLMTKTIMMSHFIRVRCRRFPENILSDSLKTRVFFLL